MHDLAKKITTRCRSAGFIAAAFILGGCSGAGVVANAPGNTPSSTSTSQPPAPATPLTLRGSPPTSVTAGTLYSFQPTVSPSAAGVTFAIAQKPKWATFNSGTGALSGTPSAGNEGMAANITITASNSSSTASIGPFAIAVDAPAALPPPATGSATLTWEAPTENTDGTALADLAGYHIYYGKNAGDLNLEIELAGTTSTSYVVSGLVPGTYYFAVTAYSSVGTESTESIVGTKTI